MNITEHMLLEGATENRGTSSPKSAARLAYLRTLVEEGSWPMRQQKPVKTVFTPPEENEREKVRERKKRIKWDKGGRW